MALAILDGNQSATTLSTIVVSSAHIPAHTVVSLGAQAITDITSAVSSGIVISGAVTIGAGTAQIGSVTASISGTVPISISVTIGNFPASQAVTFSAISVSNFPATQPVSLATLPALVASTAQIGSVTASISGTVPISIASVTISNFPATQTTTFGAVTGSISVLNFPATQPISISSVTIGNFPATQPISIASVTIGNVVTISGTVTSNLGLMESVVATEGITASSQFVKIGGHRDGANATAHIVHVSAGGALKVDGSGSTQPISGAVTIGAGTAQIGSVTASISNFPATQTTTFGAITGSVSVLNFPATQPVSIASVTIGSLPLIAGTVTAMAGTNFSQEIYQGILTYSGNEGGDGISPLFVNVGSINGALPAGTNRIGVVTIGAGTVTIGAGTAQIGSVTASLAISSTAITSGSFTSLASATLVPANTSRKMATVYNLGAGQLFVQAGETATTLGGGFMVALNSGDFYECDYTTTTLSAIFATAGTASWVSH